MIEALDAFGYMRGICTLDCWQAEHDGLGETGQKKALREFDHVSPSLQAACQWQSRCWPILG